MDSEHIKGITNKLPERIFRERSNELIVQYGICRRHAEVIVETMANYWSVDIDEKVNYFLKMVARAKVTPRDRFLDIRECNIETDK